MTIPDYLDAFPLISILIVTIAVVLVAIELGFRWGRRRLATAEGMAESEAQLSAMVGSLLALMAFIMAFSFNMAAGHYHERRALIMKDANAIGTAYLRASLVDGAEAQAIRDLLIDYTELRTEFRKIQLAQTLVTRSEEIQDEIWQHAITMANNAPPNILQSLLIQSLNEVFDVHDERVAAGLKHRVPRSLWLILASLLILSMMGIGYFSGSKGNRNPVASTGLALAFSLVLFLIADLDRPTGGIVRSDHSSMVDLLNRLETQRERF